MPFYRDLDPDRVEGLRTIDGLLELRELIRNAGVPRRDLEETLLLATWNIREFEDASFGDRFDEAYYYIAEIISHFDLVAVQEVRPNVRALDRLIGILGSYWEYLVSDVTKGRRGNRERIAYLYDSRKLRLGGIAGEIVLPPIDGQPVSQLARTPYLVGFKAGWTKLLIGSVHILWGDGKRNSPERVAEIDHVAKAMAAEADHDTAWTRNMILLGDFNIHGPDDDTMAALLRHGFVVPDPIVGARTNVNRTKTYDQIAFRYDHDRLEFTGKGGTIPFFDAVYTDEQLDVFGGDLRKADGEVPQNVGSYYKRWRTYQMSDHLPLWVQLRIDYSNRYLERKRAAAPAGPETA